MSVSGSLSLTKPESACRLGEPPPCSNRAGLPPHSSMWQLTRLRSLLAVDQNHGLLNHMDFPIGLFTTWQSASPRMRDLREKKRDPRWKPQSFL